MIRCDEVEDLLAAYSLHALTPEEAASVAEHVGSCDEHPDLIEMDAVVYAFAASGPELEPPASLKSRIMSEVLGERRDPVAEAPPSLLDWLRNIVRAPWIPYAVSSAAILAVALFGLYFGVIMDDDSTRRFVLSGDAGAAGELTIEGADGGGEIRAAGLPELNADRTYQVWALTPDATPAPVGFLTVSETGEASGAITIDLDHAIGIAVTIEPAGGSDLPTSAPVLSGDL